MANQFWATTKIKFGKRAEDGSQEGKYESKVFEPGDEVTGLSKEDMKSLWDAGALTQTRPEGQEDSSEGDDEEAKGAQSTPKPTKSTPAKTATPPSSQS